MVRGPTEIDAAWPHVPDEASLDLCALQRDRCLTHAAFVDRIGGSRAVARGPTARCAPGARMASNATSAAGWL